MSPAALTRQLFLVFTWTAFETSLGEPLFVEVGEASGVDFGHANGARGEKAITEIMGSGVLFFDYDSDGDQDLYFVNSAGPAGLFRNATGGVFEDVSAAAHVTDSGYGMGAVAGDYDADGDPDLYITCYGPNKLHRNEAGAAFYDATDEAQVGDDGLGMGAAFGDYDLDGDLDLYVANYLEFGPELNKPCTRNDTVRVICAPDAFDPEPDLFYTNDGTGRFREAATEVGLTPSGGKELGAVFTDIDLDGDLDLYVAGDRTSNLLYRNDSGRFAEVSLVAGAAYNDEGRALAGMGLAAGDYDNDGLPDLFVTNFQWDANTLYRGDGDGFYTDVTFASGIGTPSIPYMGWGAAWLDYDNDGDRDLFVANGHLDDNIELFDRCSYPQPNQLFRNDGAGGFTDVSQQAGPGLAVQKVSRGVAVADYDDDGDVDLAVNNNNQRSSLLRNDRGDGQNWLVVDPRSRDGGTAVIGTRVVVVADGQQQVREVTGGGSYLGQNNTRLHFGLGRRASVDRVLVHWPGGVQQELADVDAGQILTLKEPPESR